MATPQTRMICRQPTQFKNLLACTSESDKFQTLSAAGALQPRTCSVSRGQNLHRTLAEMRCSRHKN